MISIIDFVKAFNTDLNYRIVVHAEESGDPFTRIYSNKNEFLEKNIAVEVQKALDPKIAENKAESRNQRNAELIFLGAAVKKLLAESDTYKNRTDIERIGIALKTAMLVEFGKKHFKGFNSAVEQFEARPECQKSNQLINEIYKDPRNPHKQ